MEEQVLHRVLDSLLQETGIDYIKVSKYGNHLESTVYYMALYGSQMRTILEETLGVL